MDAKCICFFFLFSSLLSIRKICQSNDAVRVQSAGDQKNVCKQLQSFVFHQYCDVFHFICSFFGFTKFLFVVAYAVVRLPACADLKAKVFDLF